MENNLILSKESSESEIKRYFNAILELSKSDNEFQSILMKFGCWFIQEKIMLLENW